MNRSLSRIAIPALVAMVAAGREPTFDRSKGLPRMPTKRPSLAIQGMRIMDAELKRKRRKAKRLAQQP